ncbi:peptidoglycan-binding protein [Streptomyces sp. NPDC050400]|uniref:peptidoglycan-binding protein n=1 Tax=Streptomyces sp. NPDC050400 TaxID=3365610 RepID=UPI0037B2BA53
MLPSRVDTANCSLQQGNTGAGVRALQRNLNDCYGKRLEVDGIFGSLTTAALRDVQGRVGASVDGIYGPETRWALKWAQYSLETGAKVSCHYAS